MTRERTPHLQQAQQADVMLEMQLARLEQRGRQHLANIAHRDSLTFGLTWAARSALTAAVAILLLALLGWSDPLWMSVAWLVVSISALGSAYALSRQRAASGREDALILFDRALALKDRISASDEFLRSPARDGFRDAALDEARPWIGAALSTPLALPPNAAYGGRHWLFLAAAVALLLIAMLCSWGGDVSETPRAHTPVVDAFLAKLQAVLPQSEPPATGSESSASEVGRAAGQAGGGDRAQATAAADMADPQREGAGGGAGEGGAAAGRSSASRAASSAGGGAARSAGGGAQTASDPAGGGRQPDADVNSTMSARSVGGAGAVADQMAASAAAASSAAAAPAAAAMPAAASPNAPPPPGAGQNRGGQTDSSDRQGAGQKGGQSGNRTQGQGQGEGSGSGRGAGQDAVKKTRGTSTLLLAVPMDDHLIGTPGAGRVSSVTRPSSPRAASAGSVEAEDRGRRSGDAGSILERPVTRHDELVVRDFVRLRREGQGRGPK